MKRQRIGLIALVIFMSNVLSLSWSCAPDRGVARHPQGELPTIFDRTSAGRIVIVRISSFLAVLQRFEIGLDGKRLFSIGSGEYTEFPVPEGDHQIILQCSQSGASGFFLFNEMVFEDALHFVVNPSQTVYFLVSPSWKCGKIELINEAKAKKHIEGSKLIKLEESGIQ